jgi:hypothetical protein
MMTERDNEVLLMHEKLTRDLEFFARVCLRIKAKEGGDVQPFVFNKAQQYLHYRIEEHKRQRGNVRVLILKGRQQGCSTYVAARFFHKAVRGSGQSVYILSHEASTTLKLFAIAKRFYQNMHEAVRPKIVKDNEKSIIFSVNSEYSVGTAGNKNTGRGGTVQLFHGSEVGFYENTEELQTGLLQSVADLPNTEIILESTANGLGNYFHSMCMDAVNSDSGYELIFIPWFWQSEYTKQPPASFVPTKEEKELIALYNLTNGQLYWRRMKIAGLTGGEWKFKQEYPCNVNESFQTSGSSMIKPADIMAARKRQPYQEEVAPVVGGCDTARSRDRIVRVFRQGRNMLPPRIHNPKTAGILTTTQLAAQIVSDIVEFNITKYFVDCTNGWGVVDILHEMGYRGIVEGVVFSETRTLCQPELYVNKRSEMLISVRDWFEQSCPSIPDDDAVHADIASIPEPCETAAGKLYIVPKEKIAQTLGMSTDIMDSLCLTFAFPVRNSLKKSQIGLGGSRTDMFQVVCKSNSRTSKRISNTAPSAQSMFMPQFRGDRRV